MLIPFGTETVDGQKRARLLDHCPWKDIDESVYGLIELWQLFKAGHLLEAGGVMNQPVWYIEAMQTITGAKNIADTKHTREKIRQRQQQRGYGY